MKVIIIIYVVLFTNIAFGQESISSGNIGDVKYSILQPFKFSQVNGPGWVLMDGRNIEGSNLAIISGLKEIYDARGVFIRGVNQNRDDGKGDVQINRRVGSYQSDTFKKHKHEYLFPSSINSHGGNDGGGRWAGDMTDRSTTFKGGDETRPRNIALYVYIKICKSGDYNPESNKCD